MRVGLQLHFVNVLSQRPETLVTTPCIKHSGLQESPLTYLTHCDSAVKTSGQI